MKLFLKDMNIQSTVTDTTRTSFYLSSEMDDFYIKSTGITYNIYNNYVIAYGSNSVNASSESLSYFLIFNTERYMIGRNNNENIDTYLLNIAYAINTISCLYQQNTDSSYKDILFPMWYYRYDGSKMVYGGDNKGQGSATDSNIEILKSLLKLYIFNSHDNYFTTLALDGYLKTFTYTLLNITLNEYESFNIFLKKMIVCMIYNFMWGGDGTTTYGNFSTNGGQYPICFWLSCSTSTQDPGSNLIANKMADYVNFSCFIYLYKFVDILGGDLTLMNTYKVSDIITDVNVSNNYFGTWNNVKNALTNFITYLSSNITSSGVIDGNIDGDNIDATFNRLSYQLVYLYILLKKGDTRKSMNMSSSECNQYWNKIVNIPLSTIENLCINLIKYEITKQCLYLQSFTSSNIVMGNSINTILNPYIYNYSPTGNDMSGYYRQLTYMCFKELYTTSWNSTRQDTSDIFYFENHGFGYFGFKEYSNYLSYSLQSIVDTYSYNNPISNYNTDLNYFENDNYAWKKNCNTWNNGNNNPYFMWSVCSLHQINYNLYNGI